MGLKNPGISGKSQKIPKDEKMFFIWDFFGKENENPGIWDMGFGIPEKSHLKATYGYYYNRISFQTVISSSYYYNRIPFRTLLKPRSPVVFWECRYVAQIDVPNFEFTLEKATADGSSVGYGNFLSGFNWVEQIFANVSWKIVFLGKKQVEKHHY